MVKNIVFDIGNVLVDYRIKEFLAAKGFDGTMIKRILKASIMSPYWEAFERSELTEDEVLEAFASLDPEIKPELKVAFSEIHGMLTPRDFAIPLVQKLKAAGYGVYYLSNYSRKAYTECSDSVGFIPYTDGGVLSWRAGLTKPDPRVFEYFLKEMGLQAETCVMVDDTPENIAAAKALGFEGIVFEGYEQFLQELAALGVDIG